MAKKDELTREQKLDLIKGAGKGIIDLAKSNKALGYTLASLTLLALGKAKILSCGVVGTLQGVNTYIAISDVVEESGDAGFFGIGGMGETIAKGGTAIGIGALWGYECEQGKSRYSTIRDQTVGDSLTWKEGEKIERLGLSGSPWGQALGYLP